MPTPSSSSSVPTLSRLSIVADASLDNGQDAWALDSDDDDFAHHQKRQYFDAPTSAGSRDSRTSAQPSPSTLTASAASAPSPYPKPPIIERSFSSSSATSSSSNASNSVRKHAPPARPHPFPLPPATATPFRSSSLSQTQVNLDQRGRESNRRTASTHNNERSSSSWTMVSEARPPSPSRPGESIDHPISQPRIAPAGTVSLAGSPPAELGSTAAEAVLQACLQGADNSPPEPDTASTNTASSRSPPERSSASHITAHDDGARSPSIGSIALEKKREREASLFDTSIRTNVLDIVRDPFVALEGLARTVAVSASFDTSALASPSPTPTTAIHRQQEHVRNLGMARGFNELGGMGTPPFLGSPGPAAQAVVPRSASASSTNWKTGSRGSGKPLAPWSAKRQDSFDPITMAGEGVTMSGRGWGRNSSSSSLDKFYKASAAPTSVTGVASSEKDGETGSSGGQYLPLPLDTDSGGNGLRREKSVRTKRRWREFFRCLEGGGAPPVGDARSSVDLTKLRELSWNGIPSALRPIVWPLLLGYTPLNSSMRSATLTRKRQEYRKAVELAFGADAFEAEEEENVVGKRPSIKASGPIPLAAHRKNTEEEKIWHQISIDVPRTNPSLPLWQRISTQRSLERLLYIWAIRHHATGYVQGMSDLATPFFQVFLSIYLQVPLEDEEESNAIEGQTRRIEDVVEEFDPAFLPSQARLAIEADTYWCLGKLLEGIQENYIFAQPGITRQVRRMEELVGRIDAPLHAHLKSQQVEYIQFAFRWMNCLLMREISVQNVTRLWDTYLAEGPDAFSDFHLYVCSVFLCKWSKELRQMDFQGCIIFLQSLPTGDWGDKDAELLLSEAFVFKNLFGQTRHLGD